MDPFFGPGPWTTCMDPCFLPRKRRKNNNNKKKEQKIKQNKNLMRSIRSSTDSLVAWRFEPLSGPGMPRVWTVWRTQKVNTQRLINLISFVFRLFLLKNVFS